MNLKLTLKLALLALLATGAASCSDDDNTSGSGNVEPKDIDYTAANSRSWCNYMGQVAALLQQDSEDLYSAWTVSFNGGADYATQFKTQSATSGYSSPQDCASEIVDKCAEIANEVGVAKIGDPYNLYLRGNRQEALFAVESWYSWHSRDDYTNNILSIRNAYYGSLDGTVNAHSLAALVNGKDAGLDAEVRRAVADAAAAIQAIPQPFRNNINSDESRAAMVACADLEDILTNRLNPVVKACSAAELQPVIDRYVDGVVVPTYADLRTKTALLRQTVGNFIAAPSNANFEAACNAWIVAREPWEKSEAFLFGPVDVLGLDPNMDSWPLDQEQIVQILNSGSYDDLNWTDGEDEEAVEAKQGVRGFHTLEFLIFKDGKARTIK